MLHPPPPKLPKNMRTTREWSIFRFYYLQINYFVWPFYYSKILLREKLCQPFHWNGGDPITHMYNFRYENVIWDTCRNILSYIYLQNILAYNSEDVDVISTFILHPLRIKSKIKRFRFKHVTETDNLGLKVEGTFKVLRLSGVTIVLEKLQPECSQIMADGHTTNPSLTIKLSRHLASTGGATSNKQRIMIVPSIRLKYYNGD